MDYEPTEDEIKEYAEYHGADLNTDQDLFAREALKAPIPPGLKIYQRNDGEGQSIYFNGITGEILLDHPLESHYKALFDAKKRKKIINKTSNHYSLMSL